MIVLFGSARASLVWEEEKDVLCFVYDRVAKAARGISGLAVRLSQAVLEPASL